MLLEFPNPKDPQDAEVAKMVLERPEQFARTAQQWAIQYAGAPPREIDFSMYRKEESAPSKPPAAEYVFSLFVSVSFFLFLPSPSLYSPVLFCPRSLAVCQ
jgi:hypothetical protein